MIDPGLAPMIAPLNHLAINVNSRIAMNKSLKSLLVNVLGIEVFIITINILESDIEHV